MMTMTIINCTGQEVCQLGRSFAVTVSVNTFTRHEKWIASSTQGAKNCFIIMFFSSSQVLRVDRDSLCGRPSGHLQQLMGLPRQPGNPRDVTFFAHAPSTPATPTSSLSGSCRGRLSPVMRARDPRTSCALSAILRGG